MEQISIATIDDFVKSGYVLETLFCTVWVFMYTNSFEEALIRIVNEGGDADTYGVVTGAIAGHITALNQYLIAGVILSTRRMKL